MVLTFNPSGRIVSAALRKFLLNTAFSLSSFPLFFTWTQIWAFFPSSNFTFPTSCHQQLSVYLELSNSTKLFAFGHAQIFRWQDRKNLPVVTIMMSAMQPVIILSAHAITYQKESVRERAIRREKRSSFRLC